MQESFLEQKEEELMKALEIIHKKLNQNDLSIVFERFQDIEQMFDGEFNVFFPKYRERYQEIAIKYLQNVIEKSKIPAKEQSTTTITSYFMKEEMKIRDTPYYHFRKSLKELNYFNFAKKLHVDVKLRQEDHSQSVQTHLMDMYQNLIKTHNFCKTQCVGCNSFFYQFHPIELNTRKKSCQTVFLTNSRNLANQNALKPAKKQEIESSRNTKIDLFDLQDRESEHNLVREITQILNENGGFIIIGCKRVQQFGKIKSQHHYKQLCQDYMNIHFVIGESLNQQHQNNIRNGLRSIVERITPKLEIGVNIDIAFVPIKQLPYELGYDIQRLILNTEAFQRKKLHLVIIKLHPTEQGYKHDLQEVTDVMYEQSVQEPDLDYYDQSEKQARYKQFMNFVQQDMSQLEKNHERTGLKSQRSYFNGHKCDPVPYIIQPVSFN